MAELREHVFNTPNQQAEWNRLLQELARILEQEI